MEQSLPVLEMRKDFHFLVDELKLTKARALVDIVPDGPCFWVDFFNIDTTSESLADYIVD